MAEFRCTRPDCYAPGSIGHENYKARQGHYILADSAHDAARVMLAKYTADSAVDVQLADPEADYLSQPQRYYRI